MPSALLKLLIICLNGCWQVMGGTWRVCVSTHALEPVLAASQFALGVVSLNVTGQNQESAGGTVGAMELLHLQTDDEYGQTQSDLVPKGRAEFVS